MKQKAHEHYLKRRDDPEYRKSKREFDRAFARRRNVKLASASVSLVVSSFLRTMASTFPALATADQNTIAQRVHNVLFDCNMEETVKLFNVASDAHVFLKVKSAKPTMRAGLLVHVALDFVLESTLDVRVPQEVMAKIAHSHIIAFQDAKVALKEAMNTYTALNNKD
jgi:hypothetical protein